MDKSYELKYHRLEETQWWFVSRRDILLKLIEQSNFGKDARILEIGCSGGPLLKILKEAGYTHAYGIDISEKAIDLCKRREIDNAMLMDGTKTRFGDNEFDIVISSDVLEHIEDEASALSEWHRILKPDGKLIVFVPAFNFLWSGHDEVNLHYRRYSKSQLTERSGKAGFEIDKNSYWNFTLFFPAALIRLSQRLFRRKTGKPKGQLYDLNPVVNKCLVVLLRCENWFLNFFNFPVGVSVFVVCRK